MSERVRDAARQEQFLDVLDREEAARRFRAHLRLAPAGRACREFGVRAGG